MRITTDQKIAGCPAVRVRQLMRGTVSGSITLGYVRRVLRCSDSGASVILNCLEKDGFIELVRGHLEPSTKGWFADQRGAFALGCPWYWPSAQNGSRTSAGASEDPGRICQPFSQLA
jgi:hypothetical protein